MLQTSALAVLMALALGPPPSSEVLGEVAGTPLLWGDVAPWLGGDVTADGALEAAVERAIRTRLLALEAAQQLGARAQGLPDVQAARALLDATLSPATVCARPRRDLLMEAYRQDAWRFVAPPAWRVADVQLLCCRKPSECGTPAVADCLANQTDEAQALAALAPREGGARALEAWAREAATSQPRLAYKEYTFYFEPEAARRDSEKVHWRLQTVDQDLAGPVSSAEIGALVGPVRTRFGHHLLLVLGHRQRIDLGPDDPRTQALLVAQLCPFLLEDVRARFVESLRAQIAVRLDPAALLRVRRSTAPPPAP